MSDMYDDELRALRGTNIRTADHETLADIRDVKIDMSKPVRERVRDYIEQIKNPYCFRCGEFTISLSYAETETTLEQRIESYLVSDSRHE